MSSFQSTMRSLLTRKIKPNMFSRAFLILGLALLPASLANGQLSDFFKNQLLDDVITLKAHPSEEYRPYPTGLANLLNEIAKDKQKSSNATLMPKVDELCKRPDYFQWFQRRLDELWQRKDGKIDDLLAVEQKLQFESGNFREQRDGAIKRVSGLESTKLVLSARVSGLESTNQALSARVSGLESTNQVLSARVSGLESTNQVLSGKGEGSSSFFWPGILSIILGLLLLGALGLWWLDKSKAKGVSSEELARENNRLKREVENLVRLDDSRVADSSLDDEKWSQTIAELAEQKQIINELRKENIQLKHS